ncbi:ribose-phosphate pyrophosphokinase [Candidatus Woesearchaeota archaeon]|nr:ribose-phosphate pyrophosphokinase [Candidatus Woesearchaeota archaeon]
MLLEDIVRKIIPRIMVDTLMNASDVVFEKFIDRIADTPKLRKRVLDKFNLNAVSNDFLVFSYRDICRKGSGDYTLSYQDPLAKDICQGLNKKPGMLHFDRFLDNTSLYTVRDNVRRKDCYVIFNPNSESDIDGEILRLMMLTKTLKSAHCRNITAVVPCLPYSRQDQTYGKRQLVAAKFLADILDHAGIDHMITIGLHSPQIEGFYKSIDHLKTRPIFSDYLLNKVDQSFKNIVQLNGDYEEDNIKFYREHVRLISPDAGGMRGVNELRRDMDPDRLIDVGFIQKERVGVNVSESGKVVGDVAGKIVVLYDDLLDTGGSLFGAAKSLKAAGATYVISCIDHALGNSKVDEHSFEQKLHDSDIDELIITNTKPEFYERVITDKRLASKITILSVAPLLTQAIIRDQQGYTIREMVESVGKENLYHVLHQKTG